MKLAKKLMLLFLTMVILLSSVTVVQADFGDPLTEEERSNWQTILDSEPVDLWDYDVQIDDSRISQRTVFLDITVTERCLISRVFSAESVAILSKDTGEVIGIDDLSGLYFEEYRYEKVDKSGRKTPIELIDMLEDQASIRGMCETTGKWDIDLGFYYETTMIRKNYPLDLPDYFDETKHTLVFCSTAIVENKEEKDTAIIPINTAPVKGDTDGDGIVTLTDVQRMMMYMAGWNMIGHFDPVICDTDGNGALDLSDVSFWLKYIAGWDVVLVK